MRLLDEKQRGQSSSARLSPQTLREEREQDVERGVNALRRRDCMSQCFASALLGDIEIAIGDGAIRSDPRRVIVAMRRGEGQPFIVHFGSRFVGQNGAVVSEAHAFVIRSRRTRVERNASAFVIAGKKQQIGSQQLRVEIAPGQTLQSSERRSVVAGAPFNPRQESLSR